MTLPALRHRRSDVPLLTAFFVERFSRQFGKQITGIAQDTMDLLSRYDWPGNIRELQNVIERAVVLSRGSVLKLGRDLLPVSLGDAAFSNEAVTAIGANGDDAKQIALVNDSFNIVEVDPIHRNARMSLRHNQLQQLLDG